MPTLYVLSGPELGRQFDIGDGDVLGRADDCDAVLRHLSVSRRHARLEKKRAGWRVVDLASRNGLFLNGERSPKFFVEDGTEFRIGDVDVRVRLMTSAEAETLLAEPDEKLPSGYEETMPGKGAQVPPALERAIAAIEEDFEFVDETPVEAPQVAGSESQDADEITLEEPDEIELESDPIPAAPRAAAPAPPSEPPPAKRAASAPNRPSAAARAGIAPPAKTGGAQDPARKALQYHRVETQGGFLSADLGQYPGWVRFVALAVALVLFAGLFLLAFRAAGAI